MKNARVLLLAVPVLLLMSGCTSIDDKIEKGQFDMATKQINKTIAKDKISDLERIALEEKKDIMHRIELDFNKSRADVLEYIHKYYPEISEDKLRSWEWRKTLFLTFGRERIQN
jgi:hypothetical protein